MLLRRGFCLFSHELLETSTICPPSSHLVTYWRHQWWFSSCSLTAKRFGDSHLGRAPANGPMYQAQQPTENVPGLPLSSQTKTWWNVFGSLYELEITGDRLDSGNRITTSTCHPRTPAGWVRILWFGFAVELVMWKTASKIPNVLRMGQYSKNWAALYMVNRCKQS